MVYDINEDTDEKIRMERCGWKKFGQAMSDEHFLFIITIFRKKRSKYIFIENDLIILLSFLKLS